METKESKPKVNKSELFVRAWKLFRNKKFSTFGECLKYSWAISKKINFGDEFNKHKKDLQNFAMKLCNYNEQNGNDLFQETAVRLFESIHTFNPETHTDNNAFKWWAFTIMKNATIDLNRKATTKKRSASFVNMDDETNEQMINTIPSKDHCTDSNYTKAELKTALQQLISTLKPREQMLIGLWMQSYSYDEISKMCELPVSTIKTVLHRTINKLKTHKEMLQKFVA